MVELLLAFYTESIVFNCILLFGAVITTIAFLFIGIIACGLLTLLKSALFVFRTIQLLFPLFTLLIALFGLTDRISLVSLSFLISVNLLLLQIVK